MKRIIYVAVVSLWIAGIDHVVLGDETPEKFVPLKGPLIIEFNNRLEKLSVPRRQFGIFRNEEEKQIQWIEEDWKELEVPNEKKPLGFLCLKYQVPKEFNGWWLKLGGADWSAYKDGNLVLRVRPSEDCTPVFKLELKTGDGGEIFQVYLRLNDDHRKSIEKRGYADLSIKLEKFGATDWSRMAELVIVFESARIPEKNQKGILMLHSIRLEAGEKQKQNNSLEGGKKQKQNDSETLLKELGHKAFCWFKDNRHPKTGLVRDRAPNWMGRGKPSTMASIASTGYYLSMLPEAIRQGEITRKEAAEEAERLLRFVTDSADHYHGLLYHFVDWETGKQWEKCEVSVVDSAIFFNGCIVVAEAFGDPVAKLANSLIDRADWQQFVTTHPRTGKKMLSLGWTSEKGLLGPADVRSSELANAYFLAIGSRTQSIDAQLWYNTIISYRKIHDQKVLNGDHPLFTSYYGLGWHDLKGLRDRDGVDLYENAKSAILANRMFCRNLAKEHLSYRDTEGSWWGVSAGDSPTGYIASGIVSGDPDGTVWPIAALAAIPWDPEGIQKDLARWRTSNTWERVSGTYGLSPFNLDKNWIGEDLIGIDLGSFYINISNYHNRTVWNLWMQHPVAVSALRKLEYKK